MPIEMICENCEKPFYCYPSEADKGRKYCGLVCRSAHRFEKALSNENRAPVHFDCRECGNAFTMLTSYLRAYRKKFGRDPLYCSLDCKGTAQRKETDAKYTFTCVACGKINQKQRKPGGRTYVQQKYCDRKCKAEAHRQSALTRFQTALAADTLPRHQKRNGYWAVAIPSGVTGRKHHVLEHRWVMEQHLGRKLLSEETVHHRNGDRGFNKIENLELFSSRHGPGQRVIDKIDFAIEMIQTYPEFAATKGFKLVPI